MAKTCPNCGAKIPPAKFCPECGQSLVSGGIRSRARGPAGDVEGEAVVKDASATAAPTTDVEQVESAGPATKAKTATRTPSKLTLPPRMQLIGVALMVVGSLIWTNGPLTAWYTAILLIAALATLVLHHVQPQLLTKVPYVARSEGRVEIVALVLFAVGILRAGAFIGWFVYMAGWFLFVRDARRTGEVREVDPSAPMRLGWLARILAIGVLFALLVLADEWDARFSTTSQYTSGGFTYSNTFTTEASNGYQTGDSPWLALMLLPAALWLVWEPVRSWKWGRFVPLVSVGVAGIWAAYILIDDWRFVQELYEIGGTYPKFQAAGPTWFVLGCIPALVAGGLIAFRSKKQGERTSGRATA